MPIYAFACQHCGHDFERLQKLSDADPTTCPACGAEGSIVRQLSAPQFRLAGGGWYLFGRSSGDKDPKILQTATLSRGQVRKVLEGTGIVKTQVGAIVKIGARATGTIQKMLVKVGDRVKAGDLIAVIDARELQAQHAEAEARLLQAQVELARVQATFPQQISEARAQLELARARDDYAALNVRRQRQLVERDVQARDFLDQAVRDRDVARNDVAANQATLVRLTDEFPKQVAASRKAVEAAQATLESIAVRLTYTRIVSPLTGYVSQVTVQEGETVVSGLQVSNLITVIDPTRLEMWIYVDETDVGQVKPGMPVEFRVDAYRDRTFKGAIDQIYPEPEIRDNIVYYRALVRLDAEQALALRPEMTTQCQIVVQTKDDVLALPNVALKWVGDKQVVFVKDPDGAVRRVTPTLGLAGLEASEVLDGLKAGDVVATQVILPETQASKAAPPPNRRPGR